MDVKDQRIEIRLPQQTVDELDEVIGAVAGEFKPSRSDVVRSYIAQGLDRHLRRDAHEEQQPTLAQRLGLYFQFSTMDRTRLQLEGRTLNPLGSESVKDWNGQLIRNTVTIEALVRQAYVARMFWFFELDPESLKSIHRDLASSEDFLMLMAPRPGAGASRALAEVLTLRAMFLNIGAVLNEAENKVERYGYEDIKAALIRIGVHVKDNAVSLKFCGYPDTVEWKMHREMYAMLDWIEKGDGFQAIHASKKTSGEDYTEQYDTLLQAYQDAARNTRFSLEHLEDVVKDRRLRQA